MIKAAIIGMGRWGQQLVTAVQGQSPAITFAAGLTRTPAKAEAFAAEQRIPLKASYEEILADPGLDAVVLATPHSQHAEQVIAAAAAGKHVFVEKPFTLTQASAEAAAEACTDAKVVLALGHNRRFLPAMVDLRLLVRTGDLGRILHVEGNFSSPGGYRYGAGMWRADASESPAGGMTGLGIHVVDAMIHLLGPIASVHAYSLRRALTVEIDDTTAMLFRFRDGMTGYLGTMTATASLWRLQVFGSRGWAEMRGENTLAVSRIGQELELTDYPPFDSVRAELECFAEAIEGSATYPLSAEEAVHGVAVLEAVDASARGGATVAVP